MTAAPPRRLAVVLFVLFVVATGGAFFVTQRLKRSTPIVSRVFFYQWIGPTCHCRKDHVTLRFDLPNAQRVTVSLVNSAMSVNVSIKKSSLAATILLVLVMLHGLQMGNTRSRSIKVKYPACIDQI